MRLKLVIVFLLLASNGYAESKSCLNIRKVQSFDYQSGVTAIARTRDSQRFAVEFIGACGYSKFHPQLSFDQTPSGPCLARGNLLNSYDGGACVVRKITLLPPTG